MKIQKILFSIAFTCFLLTGCKNETKKETLAVNKQNVSLAISGMTCEIGCAKTIQSKLSKKEGVLNAKVVFKDSIANIEFDANTTSKKDLIAFVDGIAGGDLYKATATSKKDGAKCSAACKDKCKNKDGAKKDCKEKCKDKNETKTTEKACCSKDKNSKMFCKDDCKMACCADKKA